MKDPLDNKNRPYEILGVGRNATLAEINAAYARLAGENPSRRQELTNAWHCLRRSEKRLEEDFWYYVGVDGETGRGSIEVESQDGFHWDPELPPLDIGSWIVDLADGCFRRDFRPLEFRDLKLSRISRYEEEPAATFAVEFDK
jgi:hypothetical protein